MTGSDKVGIVLWSVIAIVVSCGSYYFWWAGRPPRRPKGLDQNAIFLPAPAVGLPAHKRGWWLSCWEVAGVDHCRQSDTDGATAYEGEFAPNQHTARSSELEIDTDKTQNAGLFLMVEGRAVPLIYLKDGAVLVPAAKYAEGLRVLGNDGGAGGNRTHE